MTNTQLEEFRKDLITARLVVNEFGILTSNSLLGIDNWFYDAPTSEMEYPYTVLDIPDKKRTSLILTIIEEMLESLVCATSENITTKEASVRLQPLWIELFALHAAMLNKSWIDNLPPTVEERIAMLEEASDMDREEILEDVLKDIEWVKTLTMYDITIDDLK